MMLLQVCFAQPSLRKHVRNRFPFFIHHMLISLRRCHYAVIAVYVVRSRCSNMIGMIDTIFCYSKKKRKKRLSSLSTSSHLVINSMYLIWSYFGKDDSCRVPSSWRRKNEVYRMYLSVFNLLKLLVWNHPAHLKGQEEKLKYAGEKIPCYIRYKIYTM